jgi:hypothetical protein
MVIVVACTKHIARPPVEEVPMRDPSESAAPTSSSPTVVVASASAKPAGKPGEPPKSTDKTPDKPDTPTAGTPSSPLFSLPVRDDGPGTEPPRDKAFPKTVDACKKDEDCAATNLALGGEFMCCTPCKPVAGAKAWVKKVEQVCAQKQRAGWHPNCAPWDCSKADAECRSGKCVVK